MDKWEVAAQLNPWHQWSPEALLGKWNRLYCQIIKAYQEGKNYPSCLLEALKVSLTQKGFEEEVPYIRARRQLAQYAIHYSRGVRLFFRWSDDQQNDQANDDNAKQADKVGQADILGQADNMGQADNVGKADNNIAISEQQFPSLERQCAVLEGQIDLAKSMFKAHEKVVACLERKFICLRKQLQQASAALLHQNIMFGRVRFVIVKNCSSHLYLVFLYVFTCILLYSCMYSKESSCPLGEKMHLP
jgi:hypothetical protein